MKNCKLELVTNKLKEKYKNSTYGELVKIILLLGEVVIAFYIYNKYDYFIGVFVLVVMLSISFPIILMLETVFEKKEKRGNIYDYYNINKNSTLFERRSILIKEYRNRIFYFITLILGLPAIIIKVDFAFLKNNSLSIATAILFLFVTVMVALRDIIISIGDIEEKISGTNKKYYKKEELVMGIENFFRYLIFYMSIALFLVTVKELKDEKKAKKENINTIAEVKLFQKKN